MRWEAEGSCSSVYQSSSDKGTEVIQPTHFPFQDIRKRNSGGISTLTQVSGNLYSKKLLSHLDQIDVDILLVLELRRKKKKRELRCVKN